jgi:hypothetical protein
MARIKTALAGMGMALTVVGALAGAAPASAATAAPGWTIGSFATPTDFSAADTLRCGATIEYNGYPPPYCDTYMVTATNVGSRPTDGSQAIVLTDTLPAGLTVRRIELYWTGYGGGGEDLVKAGLACTAVPVASSLGPVQCELPSSLFAYVGHAVEPGETVRMAIRATVDEPEAPGSLSNHASISGGGAAEAATESTNTLGMAPPPFGLTAFNLYPADLGGAAAEQAGSHPYDLDTTLGLVTAFRRTATQNLQPEDASVEDLKDAVVDLPPGFLGDAVAAPTCTFAQLATTTCPRGSVVGHILTEPRATASVDGPLYNMVAEKGAAAEFGFEDAIHTTHVMYAHLVPSPQGYVLQVTSPEIAQTTITNVEVDFYGQPAVHDGTGEAPVAMFTNPADCSGQALTTTIHVDSWQHPGAYNPDGSPNFNEPNWASASSTSPPVTGCNLLQFNPTIGVQPTTTVADSPSGLEVDLKVPQSEDPSTLATPPLRTAVVTLPAGVTINPSEAGGLGACSLSDLGMSASGEPNAAPPKCPEDSKIGTVQLTTPLLANPLPGSVYLASQGENPFHSLLALYIVVEDPATGIVVKLPGRVDLNPTTGQITTTFAEDPQLPFSELRLNLKNGARAPLATPGACGTYTTMTSLTPWSAPDSGPPATPSDSFQIASGPGGTPCAPQGFAPLFTAGTASNQAGGFSPFSLTFSRNDGEQRLGGVQVTMPPGLLGRIAGVTQCPEPQAGRGECGEGSLLGEASTAVGAGPDPYWVKGGKVYLTGPYNNGPFGLSIVVPTVAGPFTLTGNGGRGREIVRASIRVNPNTAQITVLSDPFPTILEGIPLDIRTVNVTVNRSGFMFNPTNCSASSVGGTVVSTQGAQVAVSSPFQAANCASLSFKPGFSASTAGKASKAGGASLDVKVTSGAGQANIGKVKVDLPKQLPSRLTTLQKACLAKVFEANPANCHNESDVGTATAVTPVLAHPLTGPAYLVSHGGAAFPDLEIVLQGEGITLILDGNTDIKKGITSSTFKAVPDAPVSSFELKLPTGKYSILGANGPASAKYNLCGQSLAMPTAITSQNGAVVKQTTKISVTGCAQKKALTRAQKLAKALKACRKETKGKRAACVRQVRKRYAPVKKGAKK